MTAESRLISLQILDYQKIRAAWITFPPCGLFQLAGKNAQGKSSVLNALESALCGASHTSARPVRDGAGKAELGVDLGTHRIVRNISPDGRALLHVTDASGNAVRSPQAFLDSLRLKAGYDPLEFARMKPGPLAETLRKLVGLDTSDLTARRQQVYDERTSIGRRLKEKAGAIAERKVHEDAPAEPIVLSELVKEHAAAHRQQKENDRTRAAVEMARSSLANAEARVAKLRAQLEEAIQDASESRADLEAAKEKAADLADPDLQKIQVRIESAEELNRLYHENADRARLVEEHAALARQVEGCTTEIGDLDAEAADRLARAVFPIEGLSIADDVVTFQGFPLDQSSSAERIRVSLAIAAALNPTLRLALIYDGSLLDDDTLRLVNEWAVRHDVLVLVERVGEQLADESPGVVIVDGEVAA